MKPPPRDAIERVAAAGILLVMGRTGNDSTATTAGCWQELDESGGPPSTLDVEATATRKDVEKEARIVDGRPSTAPPAATKPPSSVNEADTPQHKDITVAVVQKRQSTT